MFYIYICLKIGCEIKLSLVFILCDFLLGQLISDIHTLLGADKKSQGTPDCFLLINFSLLPLETFASDEHHACAPLQDYKITRQHTAQSVYRLAI